MIDMIFKLLLSLVLLGFLQLPIAAQDTLTLKQAIDQGLQNNYSIRVARNAQEIATNSNTLGNAGFLPQANLNYNNTNGINNSKAVLANGGVREGKGIKTSNETANALVNWTVFDGLNMFVTKERLEELQKSGELQARANIENTVAQIMINYYTLVQQQRMLIVIEDAIRLSLQRLQLAQLKKSIGSASDQAVLQATVDANADSTALIMQQGAIQNSKSDLNRLLARDVNTPFNVSQKIVVNETLQLAAFQQKIETQNIQLSLNRSALRISELSINSFRGQYLPTVNLFGGYNYLRNKNPISPAPLIQSNGLTYGVTASFNIFNGGVTYTNLKNAKIQRKTSELLYEDSKLMINNDLNKSYNEYATNLKIYKIQQANVQVAQRDVEISMGRFKLGNISDLELRITQQKLINAENTLLNAQFAAKQAEIEMKRLSGDIMVGE